MGSPMSGLHERDFYAWANEQAALLRSGDLSAADIANIAEEIESMGRGEKRELVSRLKILLLYRLKWEFQPSFQGHSWRLSIGNARVEIVDHLADNPSLRATLPETMARAYRLARGEAARETGLALKSFPAECPWSFDQAMVPMSSDAA